MTQTWTKEEQAEHRRLWVEALRSGKYQQGRMALRDLRTGGFCCLGVACQISGLGAWSAFPDVAETPMYQIGDVHYSRMYLPYPVRKWLGLATDSGVLVGSGNTLSAKNDGGASFTEIADIIERGGVEVE